MNREEPETKGNTMTDETEYVRADLHEKALAKSYAEGMRAGYGYGFSASAEGYNAENPFSDQWVKPECDKRWVHDRDVMLANVPNKYEVGS